MTIVEFLNARLGEDKAGWQAHIRNEVTQLRFFGQPLAERMIADIESKRAIIASEASPYPDGHAPNTRTLRLLASVYAEHPDYQQEWKP